MLYLLVLVSNLGNSRFIMGGMLGKMSRLGADTDGPDWRGTSTSEKRGRFAVLRVSSVAENGEHQPQNK
jgi:hypothetical protein